MKGSVYPLRRVEFHPAAAFVFIGLTPNTGFLEGALAMGEQGFIVTDETPQTSVSGVFAAGVARRGSAKQLASAGGEGATALLMGCHTSRCWEACPIGDRRRLTR